MQPNRPSNTQEGCLPISSNCVIWQGPDIPCIKLCKGDSITDVTYKVALELCELMDQLDISTLDLTCFDLTCPKIEDIHGLLQFIIDKLCELQSCCTSTTTTGRAPGTRAPGSGFSGTGCPDCLVDVAPCFYTINEFGDTVTRMQLVDYARAIGARVCSITAQITVINNTLSLHQTQINYILENFAPGAPVVLPTYLSTCLTDKIPTIPAGGIPIADMVRAIEQAFCELRTVTGMPADLLTAIFMQCAALDTSPSLNLPGVNMGSLPGWITSGRYATVADSINNMWITLCDMRASITSILKNCCPQGCDGLVVNLVSVTLNGSSPILGSPILA